MLLLPACGGKISDGDGGILENPSDDVCNRKLPCPNDTQPTEESRARCRLDLQGPCGDVTRTLSKCLFDNIQCNAEGRSDPTLSLSKCQDALNAYTKCQGSQQPPPPG